MLNSSSESADDMILYIENPKDCTRKLLELINEYSKVAGYKINTQKSLTFLYTNNEKVEKEIKETIPFTIVNTFDITPKAMSSCYQKLNLSFPVIL